VRSTIKTPPLTAVALSPTEIRRGPDVETTKVSHERIVVAFSHIQALGHTAVFRATARATQLMHRDQNECAHQGREKTQSCEENEGPRKAPR
jgi:hypothetical protein